MTPLAAFMDHPLWISVLATGLGCGLGYLHFASLRPVTDLYLAGDRVFRAIVLQLLRLGALGAGLVSLALLGAIPLLAGTLGVLIARYVALRRANRWS